MKENFVKNNFRIKHIRKDKILTINDYGSWMILNEKQLNSIEKGDIDDSLFAELENKGLILTNKNEAKIIEDFRKKSIMLFQGPSLHIVVPTLRCNHKCVYCHSKAKGVDEKQYDMDEETAKKVVEFIFQTKSNDICIEFQGGEPLLNFEIVKVIIDYALELNKKHKKNMHIGIVTNLTLMDEQKLNYLIEKKVGICTSLDGYKEIHDKNRPLGKGTGSFDMVKRWIKPVMEKSPFELNALMVTTKDSLDNMKKIIDEYTGLGFKVIQLKLLNKLGYAVKGWGGIGYEPEEFLDAWKKAMDYILEINKKGTFLCESISRNILREILTDDASPYLDLSSPCGAAIGQMAYDYNGDIYTCDEARMYDIFKLGNVKKDKMSQILSSQEACSIVMASTNESFVCDACVWKPYCGVCPVCAYAERGSIITNIPLSGRCKVLKGIFEYLFDKVLFDKEALAVFNEWITEENKKKS